MRLHITPLIVGIVLIAAPTVTRAQSAAGSSSIAGVVKDLTGAVLPGVTVEASSPALIEKVRAVVTDGQGQYKIVELRPGTYAVTFSLPGFGTVKREGLALGAGFTATQNAELQVGSVEETVTVTGASPIVDTQNVRQQSVISREVLAALPTGKMMGAMVSVTLGATATGAGLNDVGGSKGDQSTAMAIHGTDGQDMNLKVDGLLLNNTIGANAGQNRHYRLNEAAAQEMVLETGGTSAESETGGVQMNVVPKEGGNKYSVYFNAEGTTGDLQSDNVTVQLRDRGLTGAPKLKMIEDVGGGVGGPLKQDTLWFYAAARHWVSEEYQVGTYYNKTQHTLFHTDDLSRPAFTTIAAADASLRLTWQVTRKNKVNFSHSQQSNCLCGRASATQAIEATTNHHLRPVSLSLGSWSYTATNKLLFEGAASYSRNNATLTLPPETSPDDYSVLELSTGLRYGAPAALGSGPSLPGLPNHPNQVSERFSVSYVTGSHAFKTGLMLQEGWYNQSSVINHALSYTFKNQRPVSLTEWASPSQFSVRRINFGLYAQDQWTVRRLTLNLGVRFDSLRESAPAAHFNGGPFVPAYDFPAVKDAPNWKDIGPRLGAAYDLFGNGRTAVKAYLGRSVLAEGTSIIVANHPSQTIVSSADRVWNDTNGNFVPDCDLKNPGAFNECEALSNNKFGQPVVNTIWPDDILKGFGVRPYNWQASASINHELRPGLAFTAGYFRTWFQNLSATLGRGSVNTGVTDNLLVTPADYDSYCITAPVHPKLPGGGGYQVCGLYNVKPARFGQVLNQVVQVPQWKKIYNGFDVGINARFGRGGLLAGGMNTGRTTTDSCAVIDFPTQFCDVVPPFQSQFKFNGSYPLPWGLQVSGVFQNLPGVPIDASYVASNAEIQPSLKRNLAACGTRVPCTATATVSLIAPYTLFEDRLNQLDLRLSKIVRVRRARVQGKFDVYNIFNAGTVFGVNTRYGQAWLTPTTILGGRLIKGGVQVDF